MKTNGQIDNMSTSVDTMSTSLGSNSLKEEEKPFDEEKSKSSLKSAPSVSAVTYDNTTIADDSTLFTEEYERRRRPRATSREIRGATAAGAVAGFVLAGPVGALAVGALSSSLVRSKGDAGNIARRGGEAFSKVGDEIVHRVDKVSTQVMENENVQESMHQAKVSMDKGKEGAKVVWEKNVVPTWQEKVVPAWEQKVAPELKKIDDKHNITQRFACGAFGCAVENVDESLTLNDEISEDSEDSPVPSNPPVTPKDKFVADMSKSNVDEDGFPVPASSKTQRLV